MFFYMYRNIPNEMFLTYTISQKWSTDNIFVKIIIQLVWIVKLLICAIMLLVWVSHAVWQDFEQLIDISTKCVVWQCNQDGGVPGDAMTAKADRTEFSIESSNHLLCEYYALIAKTKGNSTLSGWISLQMATFSVWQAYRYCWNWF